MGWAELLHVGSMLPCGCWVIALQSQTPLLLAWTPGWQSSVRGTPLKTWARLAASLRLIGLKLQCAFLLAACGLHLMSSCWHIWSLLCLFTRLQLVSSRKPLGSHTNSNSGHTGSHGTTNHLAKLSPNPSHCFLLLSNPLQQDRLQAERAVVQLCSRSPGRRASRAHSWAIRPAAAASRIGAPAEDPSGAVHTPGQQGGSSNGARAVGPADILPKLFTTPAAPAARQHELPSPAGWWGPH